MSKIIIGRAGKRDVTINLEVFLRTRMLVQAASGAGKSHWLRRLCEQLFGKAQIFIIDHEGEFATLRPQFDFAVIGEGGDAPADVRSAALLAQKLLELRTSAVFDLSEAFRKHPRDRHAWVKTFLYSMMEAPKRLWHPVVVIVDEAHKFAPEKDESEALEAMISLATDGRKRQFCAVFATQRLGKLSKDAAAELLNVMIGGTSLDIDRKRAADALGVYGKDLRPFNDQIKVIERGNFWCLGPAIANERVLVKVGDTKTLAPKHGSAAAAEPPPPTAKIKQLLPQLADLPKLAEEKARTEAEYKKRIRELEAQIRSGQRDTKRKESGRSTGADKAIDARAIERSIAPMKKQLAILRALLGETMKLIVKVNATGFEKTSIKPEEIAQALEETAKQIAKLAQSKLAKREREFEQLKIETNRLLLKLKHALEDEDVKVNVTVQHREAIDVRETPARPIRSASGNGDAGDLTPYQKDILRGLAELEAIGRTEVPRGLAGAAAGKSHKSSTFERYTASLRSAGLIHYLGGKFMLTDAGRAAIPPINSSLTSEELQERLLRILTPYQRDIVKALIETGEEMTWEEVGEKIGKSATSSTFERYMSSLRSAEILEYSGSKKVKAAEWLWL